MVKMFSCVIKNYVGGRVARLCQSSATWHLDFADPWRVGTHILQENIEKPAPPRILTGPFVLLAVSAVQVRQMLCDTVSMFATLLWLHCFVYAGVSGSCIHM